MRSSGWTSVRQDQRLKENQEEVARIQERGGKGL